MSARLDIKEVCLAILIQGLSLDGTQFGVGFSIWSMTRPGMISDLNLTCNPKLSIGRTGQSGNSRNRLFARSLEVLRHAPRVRVHCLPNCSQLSCQQIDHGYFLISLPQVEETGVGLS
jgi:hypothetical protein